MMIMKKSMKSLFVIIAAMVTFAGCQKEENNAPATQTKTVEFFAESIETKTHFGDKNAQNQYPVYWDANDKVKVLLNIEQVSGTEKTVTVTPSDDFASARFVADITDPATAEIPVEVESYTFYSVSPSSAYNGKSSTDGRITVTIPAAQTPLATSVDKAAQVLYAVSETTATMQSSINLTYHHLTAYGKFSLANLTSDVSSVSKIRIVAPEGVYISGKWNYLVEGGNIAVHTEGMTNDITLTTTKTTDIWFSCGPLDVSEKTFKFIVTTDKGDLEKEITFPSGCIFESGKIATFTVNMAGIEPPVQDEDEPAYTLTKVTDVSQFTVGQYVLISADESHYVPNSAATSSSPKVGTVTKVNSVISVSDDMLWNAVAGEAGMLLQSAASASNYLVATGDGNTNIRVNTTLTCVWTAKELSNYGVCLMSSKSSTRYLATYGTQDWRYYQSGNIPGSSKNSPANLYKVTVNGESGGEEEPDTPAAPVLSVTATEVSVGASGGNGEIAYTVENAVAGTIISAATTVDWISNFNYSAAGKVTFAVSANTGAERSAVVTLTYPDAAESKEVTVKQAAGENGGTEKAWVLVKDVSVLSAGDKIRLGCSTKSKAAGAMGSQKYFTSVEATYSNGVMTSSSAIDITLGVESGAWTLTTSEGKIGTSAAKALKKDGTGTTTWTIEIDANGDATIKSSTTSYGWIQYNASSPRFLNYASSQTKIQIYRYQ